MNMLIIGSSHARRLGRSLEESGRVALGIAGDGIPGGRVQNPRHTRQLLAIVKAHRPRQVVLLMGGNDLAQRDLDVPSLAQELHILGLGCMALGVENVWLLPILPRTYTRSGNVSPARYEQRRLAVNRILATRFRRPPVTMVNIVYPRWVLGRDGVHMSARGEAMVLEVVRGIN